MTHQKLSDDAPSRAPLRRREPWLVMLAVGFVIVLTAAIVPHDSRRYIALAGIAAGAIGLALLMFHKPDPAEEARWREYRRPVA